MSKHIPLNSLRDSHPTPDPLGRLLLDERNRAEAITRIAALTIMEGTISRWKDFLVERAQTGRRYSDEGELEHQLYRDFDRLDLSMPDDLNPDMKVADEHDGEPADHHSDMIEWQWKDARDHGA